MLDTAEACSRARRAVAEVSANMDLREPFAAAILRAASSFGVSVDAEPLLRHLETRSASGTTGPLRYRWETSHARGTAVPSYSGEPDTWIPWHPSEQRFVDDEPHAFEERVFLPVVLSSFHALLTELTTGGGPVADSAQALLTEAEPVMRRDFASYVQARHAWADTFALYCLAHTEHALGRLRPLALAIAETYAAGCLETGGLLLGTRFPFHHKPLASGAAHLAAGLLALGSNASLVATLAAQVRDAKSDEGAFGDAGDPPDPFTTLVCADLLCAVDPSYDPEPTARWLVDRQGDDGLWRALGPDAPWLTGAIVEWLQRAALPFSHRFRWPHLSPAGLDRKTGLPPYAHFADLGVLFSEIPGLAASHTELGFIDLAGFRAFNNQYGQDKGDEVLRAFATELSKLPAARVVRDGGDEFLVLGAPERSGLYDDLAAFRETWPACFHARFGDDVAPVAPRILVRETTAGVVVEARELLGRAIGTLKDHTLAPGGRGILERLND